MTLRAAGPVAGFTSGVFASLALSTAARAIVTALAAVACLWLAGAGRANGDETERFLRAFRMHAAALALLAIGWNALPLLLVSECD